MTPVVTRWRLRLQRTNSAQAMASPVSLPRVALVSSETNARTLRDDVICDDAMRGNRSTTEPDRERR
jgi:hypothetical protein